VNQTLPSLNGKSLEITLTVPFKCKTSDNKMSLKILKELGRNNAKNISDQGYKLTSDNHLFRRSFRQFKKILDEGFFSRTD